MISVKVSNLYDLPIIPNKVAIKCDYAFLNSIYFEKDIEKNNFFCTGLFQDLKEEIIEKVFKKMVSVNYLRSETIRFELLKNIPKYVLRTLSREIPILEFSKIVFNPIFTSKYIDYLNKKFVDELYGIRADELLKYKPLPKDFDIRDMIIDYDEEEGIYKFDDSIFINYKHIFKLEEDFIDNMIFDNPKKYINILPVTTLVKNKLYEEAYEKAVKENDFTSFVVGCKKTDTDIIEKPLSKLLLRVLKEEKVQPEAIAKLIMCKKIRIPNNYFKDNNIEDTYFRGERIKSLDELNFRIDVIRNIKKVVNTVATNTGTEVDKIFSNVNDNGYSVSYIVNVHLKNRIIVQYYKRRRDKYHDSFKLVKIPGKRKVRL